MSDGLPLFWWIPQGWYSFFALDRFFLGGRPKMVGAISKNLPKLDIAAEARAPDEGVAPEAPPATEGERGATCIALEKNCATVAQMRLRSENKKRPWLF
jgi:hypothetical protein